MNMDNEMSLSSQQRLHHLEHADEANEFLYCVLDVGQAMLQYGGEISRVEDSIRRMCLAMGAERADVLTITSSIVVTIYAERFGAVTQTRRVSGQQYDLDRLERLNDLSRRVCQQHLGVEELRRGMEEIHRTPTFSFGLLLLSYAVISASFSLFFGGSWRDAVASGCIGLALKWLDRLIRRTEANDFLSALICSCLGGALAALSVRVGLGQSADMISIGNIMLLIPGIALTNSLRDMFSGNTISGLLRFSEAVIKALVIAFGFALVAALV